MAFIPFDYASYITQQAQNAAAGAGTNARPSNAAYIDEIYNNQLSGQAAALTGAAQQQAGAYAQQISGAPDLYQPLRNDAYTQSVMQQRRNNEALANMGLSAAGGTGMTFQQRAANNLQNTLGAANRQQQAYIDTITGKLSDLQTGYDADIQSLLSSTAASRNQAYLAALQDEADREMQKRQMDYSQAIQLFQLGAITPAQFKQMTGLDVSTIRGTGGGGGGGYASSDEDRYREFIKYTAGADPEDRLTVAQAELITGYKVPQGKTYTQSYQGWKGNPEDSVMKKYVPTSPFAKR